MSQFWVLVNIFSLLSLYQTTINIFKSKFTYSIFLYRLDKCNLFLISDYIMLIFTFKFNIGEIWNQKQPKLKTGYNCYVSNGKQVR